MSLEHIFAPTRHASVTSISFQRRLRLLQVVLPSLSRAAAHRYSTARPLSVERKFWTTFLSSYLEMEIGGWRFERLDGHYGDLIKRCLECLELTIDMKIEAIAQEFTSSPFPRMETLRQYIRMGNMGTEDMFLDNTIKLKKPSDPHICKNVLGALNELSRAIEDDSKQPPPENATSNQVTRPVLAPMLFNLLSTVSKYFDCNCVKPHKAVLVLSTRQSNSDTGSHSFTMLLNRNKLHNRWKETVVTVGEDSPPRPRVRIMLLGSKENIPTISRLPVSDLCKTVCSTDSSRLHLNVDGASLFQLSLTVQAKKDLEEGEPVTLAEGLFSNETELDISGKVCLALILSYSLLDFCGEPWFPIGWTKNGICFLQNGAHLSLQPMLVTSINPAIGAARLTKVPTDLKLLFHGILLLEVFRQEPLPKNLNIGKTVEIEHLRKLARAEFEVVKWGVCERFKHVVESCIDGGYGDQLDDSEDTDEAFAKLFCRIVIDPLRSDFSSLWRDLDPDEVITQLKLPCIKRKRPPPPAPKPTHFKISSHYLRTASRDLTHHVSGHIRFFDVATVVDKRDILGAERWFNLFDEESVQNQMPKRVKEEGKRIKIAILDTGIDLKNSWIQQKAGRIRCWPNDELCEDTDGHGTQVAYLLLRLAPHAQIQVAKIAKSQMLQDVEVEEIAKAIRHFSDDNRADIINLSFGFPKFHERLRPILTAIRAAREKNVVIFAAAGNEGGNQGISWPAKLYETGDVVCVNASDSEGNASCFNPTAGSENRICTLGEAVPSCQLDEKGKIIYRSGTSFSTPIAVAIAAIVLGFVNQVSERESEGNVPKDFAELKRKIHTRYGIERILHRTCVLSEEKRRVGFSYITPWFFLNIEEKSRVHIIANDLRSIPE